MRHHLKKAKNKYRSEGAIPVFKSVLRYLPIECNNLFFRLKYGPGTKVMEEDWDNLVILDACRYDMFSERIQLDGELQSRISLGSSSEEFLEENFKKRYFETVYVNTNPYVPQLGLDRGTFHAVIDLLEQWDSDLQTVRPETVVEEALAAHQRFPDKRLIVHFMQPHIPFIGETGKRLVGEDWTLGTTNEDTSGVWEHLRRGSDEVDIETFWEAYYENLDIVLAEVEKLLDELDRKTVISADHGNIVGERLFPVPTRRMYGHPYGVHTTSLVKVPWFIVEGDERRTVRSDPPVEAESISGETVESRLEASGYR